MKKQIILMLPLLLASQFSIAQNNEVNDSISLEQIYGQIPEVVVKGDKPIVKMENGKLVYNMANLLEKFPADNIYDAIKFIPGIVSVGENLSFGGANLMLLVNGKPTTLTQEQLIEQLRNIPASKLYKAEVMLSAPARYHVRGVAINIITVDYANQFKTTAQLQGTFTQSRYAKGYGKVSVSQGLGKLELNLNYGYTNGRNYASIGHEALQSVNGTLQSYADETQKTAKGYAHDINAGLSYHFSSRHSLSLNYVGQIDKVDILNKTMGTSVADQDTDGKNSLHNLDISYALPFGLRLTASYLHYGSPRNILLTGMMNENARHLSFESNQKINKILVAADQYHQIGKRWHVNYGLKYQTTSNRSYQSYIDTDLNPLSSAKAGVDHRERIVNGYAGFSTSIGQRASVEGSIAIENYNNPVANYWRVYPTLNATWMLNKNHILNLSFNSNANYPNYWSGVDQVFYASLYNEIWGNSKLKPSSDYNTTLVWQIKRKYTLVAFANLGQQSIVQQAFQPTDRLAVMMKEVNFDHRNVFGVQAMAQLNAGNRLYSNVYLTGFYSDDKCSDFYNFSFSRHKLSMRVGGDATMLLSKKTDLKLILSPAFLTESIQGLYDIGSMFTLNGSLRWTSKRGVWSVILSGSNLTNRKIVTTSIFQNQSYKMLSRQDWASGSLTVVFRLGKYKEKKQSQVDSSRLRK